MHTTFIGCILILVDTSIIFLLWNLTYLYGSEVFPLKKSDFWNSATTVFLHFQNNPKYYLDPPHKMVLDLCDCFGRVKSLVL